MIVPKYRTNIRCSMIEVEDENGNKETFNDVKSVAETLRCSTGYVYRALRTGVKIVGCSVRCV